jgi:hypothetical protein
LKTSELFKTIFLGLLLSSKSPPYMMDTLLFGVIGTDCLSTACFFVKEKAKLEAGVSI